MSEDRFRKIFACYMRANGAPEAFVKHFEETGVMDGFLWPLRWPVQFNDELAGGGSMP